MFHVLGETNPALPVVFVLKIFAVDVLCRSVFRTPRLIITFSWSGTPSSSKARLSTEYWAGLSRSVTMSEATFSPSLSANTENLIMT